MTAAATMPSMWAELPPDLLGDVAGRLRDAVDIIRFHAICTTWRDSLLSLTTTRTCRLRFPPWPLVPRKGNVLHSVVDLRHQSTACCKEVLLAEPTYISFAADSNKNKTWVASTNGTGVWLFTNTRLLNILTGVATQLPRFHEYDDRRYQRRMENLRGIVYQDGTVFLYSVIYQGGRGPVFTAGILRPGDAAWTFVKTRFGKISSCLSIHSGATYHDGKILVCVSFHHQYLLTLKDGGDHCHLSWRIRRDQPMYRDSCYVLESYGELLLVTVILKEEWFLANTEADDPAGSLSLMVQALEEEAGSGGKMRWVAKDGQTMLDRVLFLGSPASFATDAVQLAMDGGCAYFVFGLGLFRYNLVDGEAELVRWLNNDTDQTCMWLQPQLAIAPIHDIRKRIEAPKMKKQKTSPV